MHFKLISLYITNVYIIYNIKYLLIIYFLITNFFSYATVANNTYQGLTTCQSSISQNPYVFLNLTAGLILQKPLRCACPTSNQNALGVKYLLTYMVNWAIPSLTSYNPRLFGVDHQRLFDANMLSSSSVIFPFTSGSFDR